MSAEIVGGWVLKLLWSPFVAYWFYVKKKEDSDNKARDDKLSNVYTKSEIKDILVDNHTHMEEKTDLKLDALEMQLKVLQDNQTKQQEDAKKVMEILSLIRSDLAVVKNEIKKE